MLQETNKMNWQGWDITKAIKNLYEMNSSICEWIFRQLSIITIKIRQVEV